MKKYEILFASFIYISNQKVKQFETSSVHGNKYVTSLCN